jgi:phosphonate transport system substrate-binding protein
MPYISSSVLLEKYNPLADYLSQRLDRKVKIVIAKNYAEHITNTGKDRLDISFLGGSPYVKVVQKYGPKPLLARYAFNGKATFNAVIFTAADSNLTSLRQLKGRRFAFGNKNSTLSTQVPLYMLMQAGIELHDLDGYINMRNHENVIYGTLYGDFAAGAVAQELYTEHKNKGLRMLQKSQEVATHLFVTRQDMKKDLRKKIKNALLSLDDPHVLKAINTDLSGFVPVKDSDYDFHRKILRRIEKTLDML